MNVGALLEVFGVALRLGVSSFGGPVAHLGYFRAEYVSRRAWVDERTFAELVALAQFLPGAASSKLGIAIGTLRAGVGGGVAAWLGFTLPSAIVLVLFALGAQGLGPAGADRLHGLKVVAVAVVAQAVWSLARSSAWDRERGTIALAAAAVALAFPGAPAQVAIIGAAAFAGWRVLPANAATDRLHVHVPVGRGFAIACLVLFAALLAVLPLARQVAPSQALAMFDGFYRAGALVFGGGHVVLPLLQAELVPPGWLTDEQFLAGYGAAQAVPGPLFAIASYLGTMSSATPNGVAGAVLALCAIFLPSFLLTFVALGMWRELRAHPALGAALRGVNAGVVGLLFAALCTPVSTTALRTPVDAAFALLALGALAVWRLPPWLVVALTALGGALVA